MSSFQTFATRMKQRFDEMSKGELFVTEPSGDTLWSLYLAAFPEGTNPVYRERTEHDCSCCRNFVRNIGSVVCLTAGELTSVWDMEGLEYPYNEVAAKLAEHVKSQAITGIFRTSEHQYGAESTLEPLGEGKVRKWNHFYAKIANKHFSKGVDRDRGNYATTVQVFQRGLTEITRGALQTVLDLIAEKALYRGEEHARAVKDFQQLHERYLDLVPGAGRSRFVWINASSPASRFRNMAIGTLVQDLSDGVDLESAVKSFESKVAPANYKRPTALITPRMVQDAMKTIQDLDLEPSLERRHARLSDMSVNNVLWVDNSVQSRMKDGVEGLLMQAAAPRSQADGKADPIGIDEFMAHVLPQATGMEILVSNAQVGNFMSLTAPVHADSEQLFKWSNRFGWSYDGNIADSLKERVKRAGGNVTTARLRVSLGWFNYDDLDIYVHEPSGNTICFYHKCDKLDVDMNAGGPRSREPVENVSWLEPMDGIYKVSINQYNQRETTDVGFELEVENNGAIQRFSYPKAVKDTVVALAITVKNGEIVDIQRGDGVIGGSAPQDKWGVKTETFIKVNTLMKSPNHWDDNEVGNKHWFFMLDGCRNPDATRGIYNEFLLSSLDKHRKVFEVLGDKTKCKPTDDQLSGVGFSSTRGDIVLVRVTGSKLRKTYNITF